MESLRKDKSAAWCFQTNFLPCQENACCDWREAENNLPEYGQTRLQRMNHLFVITVLQMSQPMAEPQGTIAQNAYHHSMWMKCQEIDCHNAGAGWRQLG
jgi:hypothetical protein